MAQITYDVAGRQAVESVPDDLVPFYQQHPGYTVVVTEADAEQLKGQALDDKAAELGIEHRGSLTADEKRAAVVQITAPLRLVPDPALPADYEPVPSVEVQPLQGQVPDGEVTPAVIVADPDGGPAIITAADPVPPAKGSQSRAAADTTKES